MGEYGARAHPILSCDGAFDLCSLDAVAADVQLVVGAPEEFESAAREGAGAVSGAVEASARFGAERVRTEDARRQSWSPEVAAGEAWTADPDLAYLVGANFRHLRVEHVNPVAVQGRTDRGRPSGIACIGRRRRDCDLGRAVDVH
nr:hypothetical protein [Rathayibacter tritici]